MKDLATMCGYKNHQIILDPLNIIKTLIIHKAFMSLD